MNIPNLLNEQVVDKDGHFTPAWRGFFTQLTSQMQQQISEEGFWIPNQSTTNISQLGDSTKVNNGNLIYDSTINKLKVKTGDNTYETITST